MTELGLVVVNKVHASKREEERRVHRKVPLGQWHHGVRNRECTHNLVAWNGSVHDTAFGDGGALVLSDPLARKQVRR